MDKGSEATGALRTVLEGVGVTSLQQLAEKPTGEIIPLLNSASVPPSEAVLGTLVLVAVENLRAATERLERTADDQKQAMTSLDTGSRSLLTLTQWLVGLAALTLVAALATLVASVVA